MELYKFLLQDRIFFGKVFESKDELFLFISENFRKDKDEAFKLFELFKEREASGTTYLGNGIAVPHVFSLEDEELSLMFLKLGKSLVYDEEEELEARYVFAVVAPKHQKENYLKVLARIARLSMNSKFLSALERIKDKEQFLKLIKEYDEKYR